MKKLAFKMKLLPGCSDEYKKRHEAIWPELKSLLKQSGIRDYHIFLDAETGILFAVQEQSGDQSSQDLGSNPIVQRWWKYMADIMPSNPDNSPRSGDLKPVFFLA